MADQIARTAPGYENTNREDFDRALAQLEDHTKPFHMDTALRVAFTAQAFRVNGGWAALTDQERQQYMERIRTARTRGQNRT